MTKSTMTLTLFMARAVVYLMLIGETHKVVDSGALTVLLTVIVLTLESITGTLRVMNKHLQDLKHAHEVASLSIGTIAGATGDALEAVEHLQEAYNTLNASAKSPESPRKLNS